MRERATVTLKEHYDALRVADQRAIQIKEEADGRALDLAREIQVYKDEKANDLRSQIESERGRYLTVEAYQHGHRELEKIVGSLSETVTSLVTERARGVRDITTRLTIATIVIAVVVGLANHVI